MTSRMVSTQQANRRHEDKLRELEEQLNIERMRVRNKLWEDTQRLQQDLIQIRIRTPNTTHADVKTTRRPDPHVAHSGQAPSQNDRLQLLLPHPQRNKQPLQKNPPPPPLPPSEEQGVQGLEGVVSQQMSRLGVEQVLAPEQVFISADGPEIANVFAITVPDNYDNKELHYSHFDHQQKRQLQQHTFTRTDECGFRQTGLSKNGTKTNYDSTPGTEDPRPVSGDVSDAYHVQQKESSETENKDSFHPHEPKQDLNFRFPKSPKESHQNDNPQQSELNVDEEVAHFTLDPKESPYPTEFQRKLLQSKLSQQNAPQNKQKGITKHLSTIHREESPEIAMHREPSSLKEPALHLPQNVIHDEPEGVLTNLRAFKPGNKTEEAPGTRESTEACTPIVTKELPIKAQQNKEAQQIIIQSKQEAILRHQQNVLPTVEVRGSSVQYYYQGLPGRSKTFQPDTRTRALLKKTSQIGNTLNYLRHRKNSRLRQSFVEGEKLQTSEEEDSDEDDFNADPNETSKAQFESLLKGWSQAASDRWTTSKRSSRKAKMRSVLTMKSGLKSGGRPATVPDLEDSSLSGWRLLRLYRLWSNARARPVWATSDYLRRKQQEAEQHHHRQSRGGRVIDLHTTVLRAVSASVSKKPDPSSDHGVGAAAKLWMRSSTSMFRSPDLAPSLSSATVTTGNTNQLPFPNHIDPLTINNANSRFAHVAAAASKGSRRFKDSGRLLYNMALASREPLVRGRKVILGQELKMSVGNMVLSTGLTRTVAKSKHRPDVFLRNDP